MTDDPAPLPSPPFPPCPPCSPPCTWGAFKIMLSYFRRVNSFAFILSLESNRRRKKSYKKMNKLFIPEYRVTEKWSKIGQPQIKERRTTTKIHEPKYSVTSINKVTIRSTIAVEKKTDGNRWWAHNAKKKTENTNGRKQKRNKNEVNDTRLCAIFGKWIGHILSCIFDGFHSVSHRLVGRWQPLLAIVFLRASFPFWSDRTTQKIWMVCLYKW